LQFSLFGKRPLFQEAVLNRRRAEWAHDPVPAFAEAVSAIRDFLRGLLSAKGRQKETALEQEFNRSLFVNLLGYRLYPGVGGSWTAWPKPPVSATGLEGEPDLILGHFGNDQLPAILGVVELKSPGTSLDAPQPSYRNRTPVEQAFDYAQLLPSCRWVIVSDMHLVRLYAIDSQDEYHELTLTLDLVGQDDPLHEAYRLLAYNSLVLGETDSTTSRLLKSARDQQAYFRDSFYGIYSEIREALLKAIEEWSGDRFDRRQQVLAVQRLLDRLLFICFCEDHPDRLLENNLLRDLTDRAIKAPGPSMTKVYDHVKMLFRDLDIGANTEHWKIPRYNGELFKRAAIVDDLTLPDSLYSRNFAWASPSGSQRSVRGIYGLHVFDFWRELDRDLLGNLFERSIGDLEALAHGGRADARRAFGIFYTASRLARFVASSAVLAMLSDDVELNDAVGRVSVAKDSDGAVDQVIGLLQRYRVADLACGSGVFLTAALDGLLSPYRKALEAVTGGALTKQLLSFRQSEILKSCIYGVDLLPQAIELAKLALWLTAARSNEPSADLISNIFVGDSLQQGTLDRVLAAAGSKLDLVLGNPPWGAEFDRDEGLRIARDLRMSPTAALDSWEIFVALAVVSLKPGGRFALLVPDTIFSADKRRTREWLIGKCKLEKVYGLGPDWFTAEIRMGTVILQGVTTRFAPEHRISTMVLAGRNRVDAQSGRKPLVQLEATLSQTISQDRCEQDGERKIAVLASDWDSELLDRIRSRSVSLGEITNHARGDEINAEGVLWRCGNCMTYTVPGEREKAAGYRDKPCPRCGARLSGRDVVFETMISAVRRPPYNTAYIDGRALIQRYGRPLRRYMRTDLSPLLPMALRKPADLFKGPKILIRQAGVGVAATLVDDDCRCPQSIYIYRVTKNARDKGYQNEFILACLVSRTMNFIVMKRFAEIDPARAFAKLTLARIEALPIPNLASNDARVIARDVSALARGLLSGAELGGELDQKIEILLRRLWEIGPDEGRYINGFFSSLPDGQAVAGLFPEGVPAAVPPPARPVLPAHVLSGAYHAGSR
jgi:N-6 DNA Methylase/TaqI-like C-terminal specificity domain